jgi:hypothetical protein
MPWLSRAAELRFSFGRVRRVPGPTVAEGSPKMMRTSIAKRSQQGALEGPGRRPTILPGAEAQ